MRNDSLGSDIVFEKEVFFLRVTRVSFSFTSKLRWPIKLKFSQVGYFMHYVEIHHVRRLEFYNYQECPVSLTEQAWREPLMCFTYQWSMPQLYYLWARYREARNTGFYLARHRYSERDTDKNHRRYTIRNTQWWGQARHSVPLPHVWNMPNDIIQGQLYMYWLFRPNTFFFIIICYSYFLFVLLLMFRIT